MPSVKLNGIVTRYTDYKDNDRMLTLFTLEQGLVSCVSRGCRRAKSPLMGASELFVSGEYMLFDAKGKYTLDSAEISERHYPLREDIDRFAAASYMLSLINAGAEESANRPLFALLRYALAYTAYADVNPTDMAICFAFKCLMALGYRPSVTECALCSKDLRGEKQPAFNARFGGAICSSCAKAVSGQDISPLSLEAIRRMLIMKDSDINRVVLPEKQRAELKRAANDFAEFVLEKKFRAIDLI